VEFKAIKTLSDAHIAQIINYLKATETKLGLLVYFGDKLEFKRIIN
jgi:GxxExxY protein